MPRLLDVGRYMIVNENGDCECVDTQREARATISELAEQGVYAYVRDLAPELAAL